MVDQLESMLAFSDFLWQTFVRWFDVNMQTLFGSVAFLCIAVLIYINIIDAKPKVQVPVLLANEIRSAKSRRLEYFNRPRELLARGYLEYPDEVFAIDTNDGLKLFLPPRYLDVLKSHPSLSFRASIDKDMEVKYTFFGGASDQLINTIKGKMNASLPASIPVIHSIIKRKCVSIIGEYADWTPVRVHDHILKLTGTSNARVFHSTTASEDEGWVDASTGYVLSTFQCIKALKSWPPFLRPFVYQFLPERTAISDQWRRARPYVAESMRRKQAVGGAFLEEPGSMFDYLSAGKNAEIANDIEKQLHYQMTLVAVGTVTTFASITQALYDLACRPEYIAVLRTEVLEASKNSGGFYTKESLDAMPKLDSFIKESQRFSAPDLTTFQRAATADIYLPDGIFVPKGTTLAVATGAIHVDEQHYPNPMCFDGLRFYKKRKKLGAENKHLYVSVGINDLSFGFGRHACPGRFLGHANIKLVLSEILLNYDIKMAEGQLRPKNEEFEAIVSPASDAEILMKSRISVDAGMTYEDPK